MVYREKGYFLEWDVRQRLLILSAVGISDVHTKTLVDEVIEGCVRWEFFDGSCLSVFGIITSQEIQRRFSEAVGKRKDLEIIKEFWLLDDYPSCNIKLTDIAAKSAGSVIPKIVIPIPIISKITPVNSEITNLFYEPIINSEITPVIPELTPQSKVK